MSAECSSSQLAISSKHQWKFCQSTLKKTNLLNAEQEYADLYSFMENCCIVFKLLSLGLRFDEKSGASDFSESLESLMQCVQGWRFISAPVESGPKCKDNTYTVELLEQAAAFAKGDQPTVQGAYTIDQVKLGNPYPSLFQHSCTLNLSFKWDSVLQQQKAPQNHPHSYPVKASNAPRFFDCSVRDWWGRTTGLIPHLPGIISPYDIGQNTVRPKW